MKSPKQTTHRFGPFGGGYVTARDASQCGPSESPDILNFTIIENGLIRTRDGVTLSCSGMDGKVTHVRDCIVGGTSYTIIATEDDGTYRLYKKVAAGVEQIGTDTFFTGPIRVVSFNDVLMIFDGGNAKMWDGTTLALNYDSGVSAAKKLAANFNSEMISYPVVGYSPILLTTSNCNAIGVKFTTPVWEASAKIKPTTFKTLLARKGNGYTGTEKPLYMVIRDTETRTEVYSKVLDIPSILPTETSGIGTTKADYRTYENVMTDDDYSGEGDAGLDQDTEYTICVEYGGTTDADHHPWVYCYVPTVNTAPTDGVIYNTLVNAWGPDKAAPAIDLAGQFPAPKLVDGVVHKFRLFGIEGEQGDHPSYLWYTGAGNHLDWSSDNYGGYADTAKPIGGIASFYDSLWVFGTLTSPNMMRLTGEDPASFKLDESIKGIGAHYESIVSLPQDIVFMHRNGIDTVSTMQEYGDVRAVTQSDQIKDIIQTYAANTAFAAYYPNAGTYLLKLADGTDTRLYALHTRIKVAQSAGGIQVAISPVIPWELNLGTGVSITAMGGGGDTTYIGSSDGKLYRFDPTVLKDNSNAVTYRAKSSRITTGFGVQTARAVTPSVFSAGGGSYDIRFYRNHSTTALLSQTVQLQTDFSGSAPDSASQYLSNFERIRLNFDYRALQVSYENIVPENEHMTFGGLTVIAFQHGGL